MSEINPTSVTVNHLQALVEEDKAALARELHDDLGGYLIASAMDVTNLRHRFAAHDEDSLRKFDRLARMLNGAIDLMRRVTEELHPTLLDNVGLFAALRWQVKRLGDRTGFVCAAHLPDVEPPLSNAMAINLFRVGQEALLAVEGHPGVENVHLTVMTEGDSLSMHVSADGAVAALTPGGVESVGLEYLRHRVEGLRGQISIANPPEGGMSIRILLQMTEIP